MALRRVKRPPPQENLIPMINIIFMLLVFFMVAGTMKPGEPITVTPPDSRSERKAELASATVFVAADGALFAGGKPATLDALGPFVANHLEAQIAGEAPTPLLHVKADADADATAVVAVLEALRAAGIEKVRLLTQADAS